MIALANYMDDDRRPTGFGALWTLLYVMAQEYVITNIGPTHITCASIVRVLRSTPPSGPYCQTELRGRSREASGLCSYSR
jgi:hypothetical protein